MLWVQVDVVEFGDYVVLLGVDPLEKIKRKIAHRFKNIHSVTACCLLMK